MTRRDQHTLAVTSLTCLAPMLLGIALWGLLPDAILMGYGFDSAPRYAPKALMLIGLPLLMAGVQALSVYYSTTRSRGYIFARPRSWQFLYWVLPVLTLVLYFVMVEPSLGLLLTPRRIGFGLLACGLLLLGLCLPSMSYATARLLVFPRPRSIRAWRRQSVVYGRIAVVLGMCAIAATLVG